jgi:hypothetical protein
MINGVCKLKKKNVPLTDQPARIKLQNAKTTTPSNLLLHTPTPKQVYQVTDLLGAAAGAARGEAGMKAQALPASAAKARRVAGSTRIF